MVYACITSHKAVIMLFNQYSLPLTGRILTYMYIYIYIIAEHLPMAHQYEATLGGAHTEHVHVLNVHSPIHKHYTATYINTYCKASLQDKFDISAGNKYHSLNIPSLLADLIVT